MAIFELNSEIYSSSQKCMTYMFSAVQYYWCINGAPVAQQCPAGLLWSQSALRCDWPSATTCSTTAAAAATTTTTTTAKPTTATAQTTTTTSTSAPVTTTTTPATTTTTKATTKSSVQMDCSLQPYWPHPDCNKVSTYQSICRSMI